MCLLFETIKVINGEVCNLLYHQRRVAKYSDVDIFGYIVTNVAIPLMGRYKLRITYTKTHVSNHLIEQYTPKKIESLKLVVDDNIDYHQKFDDRSSLNNLVAQKGDCDDILIIKNSLVTDISFANILFFDGKRWITPETPLLEGTCRARLIAQNIITPQIIAVDDIKLYSKFMTINAMLDFNTQRAVEYYFNGDKILRLK